MPMFGLGVYRIDNNCTYGLKGRKTFSSIWSHLQRFRIPSNEFIFYEKNLFAADTCILIVGSDLIATALQQGYLLIDTAEFYNNEHSVGMAIKQSNKKREEVFVISKWWPTNEGAKGALKSLDQCLKKFVVANLLSNGSFFLLALNQTMLIST